MGKIIKIEDLVILCEPLINKSPKIKKEKTGMITRIELDKSKKIYFNTKAKKIHFRRMIEEGISYGNMIRFFKHDRFPETMFYVQAKTIEEFEKISEKDRKKFFTLSPTKGDSCCTAISLLTALNIDGKLNPNSFNSDKITKVLSDEGWIFEIDITNFINTMAR